MGVTQLRHIKLWYAGRAGNWQLTKYELARISESLIRAALLYTNIPVEYVNAANQSLGRLNEAAEAKSPERFGRSYSELTMACNSCHRVFEPGPIPWTSVSRCAFESYLRRSVEWDRRFCRWRMARHLDYGLSFGRCREVLDTLSAT
jgi:hypothetical protein